MNNELKGCIPSAEDVNKKEVPQRIDKGSQGSARELAEEILDILGQRCEFKDVTFQDFFGVDKKSIQNISNYFAPYRRSQAIWGINEFVKKKSKVMKTVNFRTDDEEPVGFERIRIQRYEFETLVVDGFYFVEYEKVKIIVEIYFLGSSSMVRIHYIKKDAEIVERFNDEFMELIKKNNFYKGERLVFLPRGFIDFLDYPPLKWNDIILSKKIQNEIELNIVLPIEKFEKHINGVPPRRGLLLGGPAGTGKTQACRILCNELPKNITIIWATPKALYGEEQISVLFEAARSFSPSLIIIEDIDFIGISRNFSQNPILGELLTQLDGNDPNYGIFVIATTNRVEYLDEALANRPSRFDVKLEFALPDDDQRLKLIHLFTKDMEFNSLPNYQQMVQLTKDLTGAQIKEVFIYAQLCGIRDREDKHIAMKDIIERVNSFNTKPSQKAMTV